jgi:hypothetical protein
VKYIGTTLGLYKRWAMLFHKRKNYARRNEMLKKHDDLAIERLKLQARR